VKSAIISATVAGSCNLLALYYLRTGRRSALGHIPQFSRFLTRPTRRSPAGKRFLERFLRKSLTTGYQLVSGHFGAGFGPVQTIFAEGDDWFAGVLGSQNTQMGSPTTHQINGARVLGSVTSQMGSLISRHIGRRGKWLRVEGGGLRARAEGGGLRPETGTGREHSLRRALQGREDGSSGTQLGAAVCSGACWVRECAKKVGDSVGLREGINSFVSGKWRLQAGTGGHRRIQTFPACGKGLGSWRSL